MNLISLSAYHAVHRSYVVLLILDMFLQRSALQLIPVVNSIWQVKQFVLGQNSKLLN